MTRGMKRAGIIITGILIVGGLVWFWLGGEPPVRYATVLVGRGDVVQTVGATGTLQAVVTVQVGSQVSGTIKELHADFNSVVKKGEVVARLDPSSFEAQVAQARANVVSAGANLEKSRAAVEDAKQKYERAKQLSAEGLIPTADLETAKSTYDGAVAQVDASQADVTQSQASLKQAEVNLQYTVIKAPIDGVVIARSVDVGQTVAASLQAPVLFTIANDLTQMEVNASVDESDVGKLYQGQDVTFHVDAYPDRQFTGRLDQVRLQPTTNQNVVTYNTIITVANPDQKLMPGMTASVSVIVQKRENVLRIPAAALKFKMADRSGGGGSREGRVRPSGGSGASAPSAPAGGPPGAAGGSPRAGSGEGWRERRQGGQSTAAGPVDVGQRGMVYVLGDQGPQPTRIVTGASDGQFVEVKEGLTEGASVVTGIESGTAASAARATPGSANPFNPQPQRRQR
jgi:HlyD family secretion protein